MITRTVGGIFRGKATPMQFYMACILGALLGFMPGFKQAPGLIVLFTLLLLILNANLGLAAIVGLISKVLCIALMPLTFLIGQGLLYGPTQEAFKFLINAPVTALFGLEYLVTTGGVAMGLLFGLIFGFIVNRAVAKFRRHMSTIEENSERYQKYASKKSSKTIMWLLAGGGKGKFTYAQLLQRKYGNPFRIWGAALAVLAVISLFILKSFISGPILKHYLIAGLEKANGATVDVQNVDLDLGAGSLTVHGLAMADPKALDTDLIRAETLSGKISTSNLLRKRVQIDLIEVVGASNGDKRATPGVLIGPKIEPEQPKADKTLDDYLKDAQLWKDRLAQAQHWLEKLSGKKKGEGDKPETTAERLKREAGENGLAQVRAEDLLEDAPTCLIKVIHVGALRIPALGAETLDLRLADIASEPGIVDAPPVIALQSSKKTVTFVAKLFTASRSAGKTLIDGAFNNLSADTIAKSLIGGDQPPLKGGTVNLGLHGNWTPSAMDLPITVSVNNSTVAIPGVGQQKIKQLVFPLGLTGTFAAPIPHFDPQAFAKSLTAAGANELAKGLQDKLTGELGKKLPVDPSKIGIDPGKILDDPGKIIDPSKLDPSKLDPGSIFGGGKKPATKPKKDKAQDSGK